MNSKLIMFMVGFGMFAQVGLQSQAYVLKNPVDLNPTAVQNSGATYGPNVVTSMPGDWSQNSTVMERAPADGQDFTDNLFRDNNVYTTDTREEAVQITREANQSVAAESISRTEYPNETVTTTDSSALVNTDQQAQMEAPRTGFMPWIASIIGLVIVAGLLYAAKRREDHHTHYRM